jgi:hypothetical protein
VIVSEWKEYTVRFYKHAPLVGGRSIEPDILVGVKRIRATSYMEAEQLAKDIQGKDEQKKLSHHMDFDFTEATV